MATVRSYRDWMARYAGMRLIDVWYSCITDEAIRDAAEAQFARLPDAATDASRLDAMFAKARGRTP